MRDDDGNQGVSLHGLTPHAAPRIMAVASHGDRASELPLLWSLCMSWTALGYSVAVLDATIAETSANPGLEQLLDGGYWPDQAETAHASWVIHPAAQGCRQLCPRENGGKLALQPLASLFHNHDVILIFAPAPWVCAFLPDTGLQPLLAVSGSEKSILTAYQALKQMLLNTGLQPTIISVAHESNSAPGHNAIKSLQDCAMTFLGHQLSILPVHSLEAVDGRTSDEADGLALRLLENAVPVCRAPAGAPRQGLSAPLGRSH